MIEMRWKNVKVLTSAAVAAIAAAMASAPTAAFAQEAQCSADEGPSKTLATATAKVLGTVFEQMQAEQFQEALVALNDLVARRGGTMKPYDQATTYELRGSVKANLEDYRGALADFQRALNLNALPNARNNQLRYYIAQLQFQEEQYQSAISGLNNWIRNAQACGVEVDPNAYYLLAAAYTQIEPPNWRAARDPAVKALAANKAQGEPRKGYYDLLNLIYSELGDFSKRIPILEEMVNLWPGTKGYWTQLSGAHSTVGNDRDAFSVLEVAYRAGLLTTESEMLTLVQYYSFFDNPYRGAELLDRELKAGNIKRNQKNLVLLSQLWSQAREHKKSIPILREAAKGSNKGELYYRLGQVLLADEQYKAAQTALERALNRGGMKRNTTGDAWLLLGTARFSQAGPEDTAIWASARKAFVNAQRYEKARKRATDWITYIDAVRSTYDTGKEIERRQIEQRCQQDQDRLDQQQRIRDLQNRQVTNEERATEAEFLQRCTGPLQLDAVEETSSAAEGGGGGGEE
jgi:tetratricopeptide (TPR) repeat protein